MLPKSPSRFLPSSRLRLGLLVLVVAIATIGLAVTSSAVWEPELIRMEWAQSPRANSYAFCPEGKVCIEWCRIYQGQIEEASGRLCCGTVDMIGSENPSCPE